jgi:hypothetical protein
MRWASRQRARAPGSCLFGGQRACCAPRASRPASRLPPAAADPLPSPPAAKGKLTSRLRTSVVPSASAASSRMRLDSDLEPGSLTVPAIFLTGWIVSCSTAVGEEVEGGAGGAGGVGGASHRAGGGGRGRAASAAAAGGAGARARAASGGRAAPMAVPARPVGCRRPPLTLLGRRGGCDDAQGAGPRGPGTHAGRGALPGAGTATGRMESAAICAMRAGHAAAARPRRDAHGARGRGARRARECARLHGCEQCERPRSGTRQKAGAAVAPATVGAAWRCEGGCAGVGVVRTRLSTPIPTNWRATAPPPRPSTHPSPARARSRATRRPAAVLGGAPHAQEASSRWGPARGRPRAAPDALQGFLRGVGQAPVAGGAPDRRGAASLRAWGGRPPAHWPARAGAAAGVAQTAAVRCAAPPRRALRAGGRRLAGAAAPAEPRRWRP